MTTPAFIRNPIMIDARPLILIVVFLSLISMAQNSPRIAATSFQPYYAAPMPIAATDTARVTVPADSLTAYIVAEVRKVETKMQRAHMVTEARPDPFEIAVFELYRREGYRPLAYRCPAGLETIGFGDVIDTQAERILRATGLPFSDARGRLYANLKTGADEINRRFPGHYPKPNQWLALTMLGHSIGWDRLKSKYPDFYAEIAAGRPSARWLKYCRYIDGRTKKVKRSANLVRTRNVEWLLFNGDFSALHAYHVDATRIAGIRWAEGRRLSLQKLGRE